MDSTELLNSLGEQRLLAIIRGDDPDACFRTAMTLVEAGIRHVEVSLTSTDALAVITRVCAATPGGAHIGAGTVLTAADARAVADAGAAYIVTPAFGPSLAAAVDLGLPALAGALTPSEAHSAMSAGAAAIKLFPASLGGPDYLSALRDPFPSMPFIPVGGVNRDAAIEYLRRGALAVGVGSPLVGDAARGGDLRALSARARDFLVAVQDGDA